MAVRTHPFLHTYKNMPATNELLQEGRYRINQPMPLDGKGNVYEAYDTVRDTNVVVKEIIVRLNRVTTASQQESMKTEFANQAKILAGIEHGSLLHVHDYFSEIGRQYLVMESVDGDDLAELLARNRSAFAVADVVDWADQLLDALNYLHTFRPPIIHRNVQPRHIKLNSAGRIKLLAFGLANGDDVKVSTALKDDQSDAVINYSPLESIWDGLDAASQKVIANSYDDRSARLLKEPADARSDIYSLGATLYHLITGLVPVDPLERSIELLDGNADPLKAPHKVDPRVPVELSEVLMRSLEIKRENRFDSAVIMRQVVRTAMVRAREREEASEEQEAAADIKPTEQMRTAKTTTPAEAEKLSKEKAAAALAEQEKAKAVARAQAEAEAVLRELKEEFLEPEGDAFEAVRPQTSNAEHVEKDPLDAEILESFVDEEVVAANESMVVISPETAEVAAYEAAAPAITDVRHPRTADEEIDLGGLFSEPAASARSGMGMPVMAGIAVLVLVVAVAGWFMMSSGAKPAPPVASQPVVVEQPQPEQPAQQVNAVVETPAESPITSPDAASDLSGTSPAQSSAPNRQAAPAAKAKKPTADPAKPAAAKKAVTVDDLINDN